GSVMVNSGTNYTFYGSGSISRSASIVKDGSGTLTISNANTFTGTVTINAGTLRVGVNMPQALGSADGGTIIASGATLDLNTNVGAEPITVSGSGVDNNDAIINSGSIQVINAL